MSAFQNIGVKEYFKRYGLYYGVIRGCFLINPIHFITDYENKKILYYKKIRKVLKRKYLTQSEKFPAGLEYGESDAENSIWIYWKQGLDNAPDIVKACIKSIYKYCDGHNVVLLSDENITDYVKMPSSIIYKNKSGIISNAALSDLIRFSLLEHYGGTWIDATVYLTSKIPDYITDSNFFSFTDECGNINNPALVTSWFMHAKKNTELIRIARNMQFAYWEKEKHISEYLIPYIFLSISKEICECKGECFFMASNNTKYLFSILDRQYDKKYLDVASGISSIHKLSYKIKSEVLEDKNNVYNAIINEIVK